MFKDGILSINEKNEMMIIHEIYVFPSQSLLWDYSNQSRLIMSVSLLCWMIHVLQ